MKLYNTLSRKKEEFKPLVGKKVKLYACGLTVYSQPHIGNWVAYIYWDALVRTLRSEGYDVQHIQNITDVGHLTSDEDAGEDKMLKGALKEGKTAWEVADKYIKIADHEAYEQLRLTRPTNLPRATEYIDEQVDFVRKLEENGYTYVIKDGVYFDTSKLKDYGKLAKLDIKGLQFGKRVEATGKKNPTDFAVWKFSNEQEKRDMEWDSPWGKGFPGWHLECSVMARRLLGDQIDIHTGGIDHIPVHHTNEIAQTEAITHKQFSQFWIHANHIKVDGTKMSKSLGNIYTLQDITNKGFDIQAFKLLVLGKHYQTEGNFTWEILEAAQNRLKKWQAIADLRWQADALSDEVPTKNSRNWKVQQALRATGEQLQTYLADDLDTPAALTTIDQVWKIIENTDNLSRHTLPDLEMLLQSIDELLGINLLQADIPDEIKQVITDREAAREAKDWAKSDELREHLVGWQIEVKDTPTGTIWSRL